MEETTPGTVATAESAAPAELEAAPGHEGYTPLATRGEGHSHPSPLKYIGVAAVLAIVTAIEVGVYYLDMNDFLMVAILMTLALIKFTFVALFFMHLRFDNRILRRFFITGIILAMVVYFIALITMDVLFG